MTCLRVSKECQEGRHKDCPRGEGAPGVCGGWLCSCPCHIPRPPPLADTLAKLDEFEAKSKESRFMVGEENVMGNLEAAMKAIAEISWSPESKDDLMRIFRVYHGEQGPPFAGQRGVVFDSHERTRDEILSEKPSMQPTACFCCGEPVSEPCATTNGPRHWHDECPAPMLRLEAGCQVAWDNAPVRDVENIARAIHKDHVLIETPIGCSAAFRRGDSVRVVRAAVPKVGDCVRTEHGDLGLISVLPTGEHEYYNIANSDETGQQCKRAGFTIVCQKERTRAT